MQQHLSVLLLYQDVEKCISGSALIKRKIIILLFFVTI